jgi:hypothetical protein
MQLLYNMKLVSGIHGKQRLNFQRFWNSPSGVLLYRYLLIIIAMKLQVQLKIQYFGSGSESALDPHSMGSWIRIQKEENQPRKRRKIKSEDQKKL